MSIVEYTTIGGGLASADRKINRRYFWVRRGSVGKKRLLYRRGELKNLPAFSVIPEAADAWNLLDSGTKSAWETAAIECGLTGYNLFIQDKIYRINHNIAGNAEPLEEHQYLIGHLIIPEFSGHFLLRQTENNLTESSSVLHIHHASSLTDEAPETGYIKVKYTYEYESGGILLRQSNEINMDLDVEWTSRNVNITDHEGKTGLWELEIEGDHVSGQFWFDNLYVTSPVGILTKDANCNQVEKSFSGLIIPNGLIYESIYPDD
jgi:hypothetical protein